MKYFARIIFAAALVAGAPVHAENGIAPTLGLEQKIAYQQGQFGALYAHCGNVMDRDVIGGTLANWRMETFRGYNGSPVELASVEKAFDAAANDVMSNSSSCQNWIKQAALTWNNIVHLSQYGTPVASN